MNYSIISKYRSQIMAIAILWIAVLHATMWFPIEPINWIKLIGQGGVDIFLFVSSFGLYYAYQKGTSTKDFIIKRIIRILPFFIPIALFRWYYMDYSLTNGLLLVSTLSFWVLGDRSMWYISAIIPLYILTPFYLQKIKGNEFKATIITVIITFFLGFFFFNTDYIVFTSRIPVFFLGFLAGKYSYEKKTITGKALLIHLLVMILGFAILRVAFPYGEALLWGYGLYWYPFLLICWPLSIFIGLFFEFTDKIKFTFLSDTFGKIGKVTLEFYLLHELMIKVFSNIITIASQYNHYGIVLNVLILFITYYISKYYHWFITWIISLFEKKKLA